MENAHSRLFLAYEYVEYYVVMDRKMLKSIQYDYCWDFNKYSVVLEATPAVIYISAHYV